MVALCNGLPRYSNGDFKPVQPSCKQGERTFIQQATDKVVYSPWVRKKGQVEISTLHQLFWEIDSLKLLLHAQNSNYFLPV